MSYLYQALVARVDNWRAENYPCPDYPAIREILEFAIEDGESGQLRYLRRAQLRAERPLVVSCGKRHSQWAAVVDPCGHVGKSPQRLAHMPIGRIAVVKSRFA